MKKIKNDALALGSHKESTGLKWAEKFIFKYWSSSGHLKKNIFLGLWFLWNTPW